MAAISFKPISTKYKKKISVVITVYNEQDNIIPLAKVLHTVLDAQDYDYEIIFVDDGSVDCTYEMLRFVQVQAQNLTIIRLKKNFGQTPAFSAGFSYASGDYTISMDGDLQNDPQDIPKLLEAIEGKYDAICGWRKHRQDSATKRFVSRAFNLIRYLIFRDPVHDTSCSLKIFRSEVLKSLLPLRSKMHGCLTSMLYLRGYEVGEIEVNHQPRIHGETKYRNPFRIFRIFWMLLYVRFWWYYTHQPQKENTLDWSQIREIAKPQPHQLAIQGQSVSQEIKMSIQPTIDTEKQKPQNRISLHRQCGNTAHQKDMVELVNPECLATFTTHNSEELRTALTFANDSTTRVWSVHQLNRLMALGCWRFLLWDSQVLDCPSGSVGGLWTEGDYTEQRHRLETVLKACSADAEAHGVRFLSIRLPESALAALHAVEAVGFRIIESFLTFSRKTVREIPFVHSEIREGGSDFQVRLARPDEMEIVASIAYRAFQSFRLRIDPQITESRARHSRREWVRNGFKGRAEAIYVAESERHIVGFVLLRSKTGMRKTGEIELIGVEPGFHGRGIGKALVAQAIRHYQGKTSKIHVGTQAKNLRAVGLYTRMGFSVVGSEFSFHRHSDGAPVTNSVPSSDTKGSHPLTTETS